MQVSKRRREEGRNRGIERRREEEREGGMIKN